MAQIKTLKYGRHVATISEWPPRRECQYDNLSIVFDAMLPLDMKPSTIWWNYEMPLAFKTLDMCQSS